MNTLPHSEPTTVFREKHLKSMGFDTHPGPGFCLNVDLDRLSPGEEERLVPEPFDPDLKMIQWFCPPGLPRLPLKALSRTARSGIWNHVSAPGLSTNPEWAELRQTVLDHPHIVDSFQDTQTRSGLFASDLNPEDGGVYDRIQPLPGIPAWQTLSDPSEILALLRRRPKSVLSRLRWDEAGGRILCLGTRISYRFARPQDLPAGFPDQICRMVAAGGAVQATHVRANLEKAHLIGYAEEFGVIVADSSLKHPRPEFIRRLNHETGYDFTGFLERGYTSVRPEYRSLGVGRTLLKGLTDRAGGQKVFSIIGEDNVATQKMALAVQTRKITTYFSHELDKPLGVWMPETMEPVKAL